MAKQKNKVSDLDDFDIVTMILLTDPKRKLTLIQRKED